MSQVHGSGWEGLLSINNTQRVNVQHQRANTTQKQQQRTMYNTETKATHKYKPETTSTCNYNPEITIKTRKFKYIPFKNQNQNLNVPILLPILGGKRTRADH